MSESNGPNDARPATPATLNRRRLLRAAALAPAVPIAAAIPTLPSLATMAPTPAAPVAPRLGDPLPVAWRRWRGDNGHTFFDLFDMMVTEAACWTYWPVAELAMESAESKARWSPSRRHVGALSDAHVRHATTATEQALRLGYALAMTSDRAAAGPDAWYAAAVKYAGITLMTKTEYAAAYEKISTFNLEEARRLGYIVDEQPAATLTPEEEILGLARDICERLSEGERI